MSNAKTAGDYGGPSDIWTLMANEWPNTPDAARVTNAHAALMLLREHVTGTVYEDPEFITVTDAAGNSYQYDVAHTAAPNISITSEDSRDVVALNTCLQAMRMQQSAVDLFQLIDFHARPNDPEKRHAVASLTDQQWYSGSINTMLQAVAENADDAYSIGISWQQWMTSIPDKAAYVMTKLSRDQDWMGFNSYLHNLQDVKFILYANVENPNVPGHVLGMPAQDNDISDHRHEQFPSGQATMLRDLLLWHGATECVWAGQRR